MNRHHKNHQTDRPQCSHVIKCKCNWAPNSRDERAECFNHPLPAVCRCVIAQYLPISIHNYIFMSGTNITNDTLGHTRPLRVLFSIYACYRFRSPSTVPRTESPQTTGAHLRRCRPATDPGTCEQPPPSATTCRRPRRRSHSWRASCSAAAAGAAATWPAQRCAKTRPCSQHSALSRWRPVQTRRTPLQPANLRSAGHRPDAVRHPREWPQPAPSLRLRHKRAVQPEREVELFGLHACM